jgi:hypothetical protein
MLLFSLLGCDSNAEKKDEDKTGDTESPRSAEKELEDSKRLSAQNVSDSSETEYHLVQVDEQDCSDLPGDSELVSPANACVSPSFGPHSLGPMDYDGELVGYDDALTIIGEVYKIDNDNYILTRGFFHAYQFSYSFILVTYKSDTIETTLLKFPQYDVDTKMVEMRSSVAGLLSFNEKTKIFSLYTKGAGYGGLSTKTAVKLKGRSLILVNQYGTKDFIDKDYELNGTENDWYLQIGPPKQENTTCPKKNL